MNRDPALVHPRTLPSGTVTFVFTDIEGSTQRWDQDRSAMQAAVRRHDGLMRAAIAEHGGHVFKTIGDAFCAAFARPADAVAAILAVQLALAAEDFAAVGGLRVRAAIHTGTADERDGDYFGPAVNRVARLLAIGHGGQVLISGVSADLVAGDLPARASLRDLGEHRLRDLARPEYVYQLLAPGLAPTFPPLRSLEGFPNNLPRMPNSLIGRETEIGEIIALVEKNHLVTLVGSGGLGKTRTALQVAANLLDGSGDGVWFIELAPVSSGDYIPSVVAHALGLGLGDTGDPIETLAHALKSKRALLVFDNCEHLVEPASRVISVLLRTCPHLHVLATSRQGLGIAAEATYRMPSLGIPKDGDGATLTGAGAMRYEAIALFVERARAVDHRFELSDENAPIIADICRRLDGIPLALELAASRVTILSPRQLRERLDERFRVLTGGSRDVLPRQQTLRALIDWSHDLLDERERVLFRRLGIFVNGFTLEGAVAVGSGDDLDEFDVLDVLSSLVDKSLVLAEPSGDSLRYRLLESTRAYAAEKLASAGELEAIRERRFRYLADLFAGVRERFERTGRETELYNVFATEVEDVRSALDDAMQRGDVVLAARFLIDIGDMWSTPSEGAARNEACLAAVPIDDALLRAQLSTNLAEMLGTASRKTRAREIGQEAIAYARASGDAPVLADALARYAWINLGLGRIDDARTALAEAEAIPGVRTAIRMLCQRSRAFLNHVTDSSAAAVEIWEQLRIEHRSLGNGGAELAAVISLAECEYGRGNTDRSIALAREMIEHRRNKKKDPGPLLLQNLAAYLIAVDDLAGAVENAREAMRLYAAREPDGDLQTHVIEHVALIAALRGDLARAARLGGYVNAAVARLGSEREYTELVTQKRLGELLEAGLASEELARFRAAGAALTPDAAIALAHEVVT